MKEYSKLYFELQKSVSSNFNIATIEKGIANTIPTEASGYDELKTEIRRAIDLTRNNMFIDGTKHSLFIHGETGTGKCLAKGTKVLMFDGTLKTAEDIEVGDKIIGPDSNERIIKSVTSGTEEMFDIIPTKGEAYNVNRSHILSLNMSGKENNKIVNISVEDYLKKNKTFKNYAKGYRTSIDWREQDTALDPYFLGLWLGDGRSNGDPSITNIDKEVINYLREYAGTFDGLSVSEYKSENRVSSYAITGKRGISNPIKEEFKKLNLINNKHIPQEYKINSREKRLQLLAGLIDTDGSCDNKKGFDLIQKKENLIDDIIFLVRSLGLAAYKKKCIKSAYKGHKGTYYRIYISGDCSIIPTRINRKKANKRKQIKDVLKTGIKVRSTGVNTYYGFEISGEDKLFVLGDFTVTHNTEIIKQIAEENPDCIYHKLEIQKVPIEELQGFPFLHKTPEGKTVVKLAQPTVLPPTDDDRVWILHLDEFNKADTESMAAVMNLILTGEIGGSADFNEETGKSEKYTLPKRTVIIGSGNRKVQKNVSSFNSVNNLDTATAERWHRNISIGYNAPSWLNSFAFRTFEFNRIKLPTRIPSILCYYIFDKFMEDGRVESPFLIPKNNNDDEEGDSTMSPRAWTLVANNMIFDMINWWNKDKLSKEKYANFSKFYQDPNVQIKALINNINEFGITNGVQVVQDIIGKYAYFAENRVLPEDVLFDYVNVRDKIKKLSEKKGAMLYLLLSVAHSVAEVDKWDGDAGVKMPALNLSTFMTDTNIPAEDLTVFIYELNNIKTKPAEELGELLYSINDRYKNSYQGYYYTSDQELFGLQKEKTNNE